MNGGGLGHQEKFRRVCKSHAHQLNVNKNSSDYSNYENLLRYQHFAQQRPYSPPLNPTSPQESWKQLQTLHALQQKLMNEAAFMTSNHPKSNGNHLDHGCMTPPASESRSYSSANSLSMYSLLESLPSTCDFDVPSYLRNEYENNVLFENIVDQNKHFQDEENKKIYSADTVHTLVKTSRDETKPRIVSNKVFVGGISQSMERSKINNFFAKFGDVFVDWPVKMNKSGSMNRKNQVTSYSYLFLVYSSEESVLKLMKECMNPAENIYYVKVPDSQNDVIQIRPWFLRNAFYIYPGAEHKKVIDIHRTVFVGGLPRIVTADEIAKMFTEFGKVLLVTIDLDQDYGYPKGAARVVFEKDTSFNMALERKYLKFNNIDSSKTQIEIKPYVMENAGCDQCGGLWFNPFIDIMQHLNDSSKRRIGNVEPFSIWSYDGPFADTNKKQFDYDFVAFSEDGFPENQNDFEDPETKDLQKGCAEFLKTTRKFNLDKNPKVVRVNGVDYQLGPDYWALMLPQPDLGITSAEQPIEATIRTRLTLKRDRMYGNKSNYCKDKPCRQYYCSSCSHRLHSGNNHSLLPTGKPERRPRKDKNMYLVSSTHNSTNPSQFSKYRTPHL